MNSNRVINSCVKQYYTDCDRAACCAVVYRPAMRATLNNYRHTPTLSPHRFFAYALPLAQIQPNKPRPRRNKYVYDFSTLPHFRLPPQRYAERYGTVPGYTLTTPGTGPSPVAAPTVALDWDRTGAVRLRYNPPPHTLARETPHHRAGGERCCDNIITRPSFR
ncbi:hypothetical protein J6590_065491 [Homalodisca vitripennis]|nr:hypothetical protein J6590_065491 [Homalodisca vitripennis]